MPDYTEIRGSIPATFETELAEALSGLPILGVQVGEERSGWVQIRVWITTGADEPARRIRTILENLGAETIDRRVGPARDWAADWRDALTAFDVGELWWIDPHPERVSAPPEGRFSLVVEPRAAFGSGTHESTQLVLLELEERGCEGLSVLDLGTGSGVLAVAADRLGARVVVAIDADPLAAWEARTTAARQRWRCHPHVVAGSTECLGDVNFDLVLCNMITSEFGPLLDDIRRLLAPAGSVVFSGILDREHGAVVALLDGTGMTAVGDRSLDGWISVRAVVEEAV
jgi:ribosomal protein L11 methyltransferase